MSLYKKILFAAALMSNAALAEGTLDYKVVDGMLVSADKGHRKVHVWMLDNNNKYAGALDYDAFMKYAFITERLLLETS